MPDYDYHPPVRQLLTLGERSLRGPHPTDYLALGINESHLGELARMSRDEALNEAESNTREVWGPTHAMRAMIQVGTEATIEPLVRLLEYDDDADYDDLDDWPLEEIPEAFGKMGLVAIPRCIDLLRDETKHLYSRLAAAQALERIAKKHPQTRAECLGALVEQLERYAENGPEWNGWLAALLVDMKAVEAAPLIERAYAADMVDETIQGDWDEVQAALGLRGPLSDEELAEKAKKRKAAHGWLSPDDMLSDQELIEEMMEGFIDEQEAEDAAADDDQRFDEPHGPEQSERMRLPEEIFTADQRRELAELRKKERKAAERAKLREKQHKRKR
jgi:HEAT repeat protein